jgi:hypothetical protein
MRVAEVTRCLRYGVRRVEKWLSIFDDERACVIAVPDARCALRNHKKYKQA